MEYLYVEQLIAELTVERLQAPGLPRTSHLSKERLTPDPMQPLSQPPSYKLSPVVTAQMIQRGVPLRARDSRSSFRPAGQEHPQAVLPAREARKRYD